MNFQNPLFIIPVLAGSSFVIIGTIMLKFPPKTINSIYGYRTSTSMKSQERWDFAQCYSAKEMIKSGAILALTSPLSLFYNPTEAIGTAVGLGLMLATVIIWIVKTERAISNRFGNTR